MTDLNTKSFTIYNTIPGTDDSNPSYGWRHVVHKCNKQQGFRKIISGDAVTTANKTTFFCKDFGAYLPPTSLPGGYYALPAEKRAEHFTLAVGDLIVFAVVEDEINHNKSSELNDLKKKYSQISMTVQEAFAYLNGMRTDHLEAISE